MVLIQGPIRYCLDSKYLNRKGPSANFKLVAELVAVDVW